MNLERRNRIASLVAQISVLREEVTIILHEETVQKETMESAEQYASASYYQVDTAVMLLTVAAAELLSAMNELTAAVDV